MVLDLFEQNVLVEGVSDEVFHQWMLHIVIGSLAVLAISVVFDFLWHRKALACMPERSLVGKDHRSTV